MDPLLVTAFAVVTAATIGTAVLLVAIKLIHREVQRWRGVRTAHYVAAVGEMVSRGMIPSRPPSAWGEDPLFHDALADYALLFTGAERQIVDDLVARLGITEALRRRIRRPFPVTTRLRAVSSLVDLATQDQVPDLRALIHDHNTHVRVHAIRGLARLGDVESVGPILGLGTEVKPWEAARIADALVEFGPDAGEAIATWIDRESNAIDPSVEMVGLAARALGLIGDPDAEATLIMLLGSNLADWRVAAASALEHTGSDGAVEPLTRALGDGTWRVRARAATALGAMADPSVAPAVARLLRDREWWVRQNAAAALTRLPSGTTHLVEALDGDDPYAADAALSQLTTSGALGEASERVADGTAVEIDRRLLERARRHALVPDVIRPDKGATV